MTGIISALIILASILLILVVLVQNSKGGGLSSTFAASNQVMGVRKTTDFLEKSTWSLVATLVVLCLLSTVMNRSSEPKAQQSVSQEKAESATPTAPAKAPAAAPAPSAPAPAATPAPVK
ncbi:MAG TPA: preprotein translocase subunit SecG [Flavobacteriales bacterium]|nr:preprotein translocase subunit SecG [Flavobacteriales bacterium]HPH83277.1 preprotein translocase subunit SecG [Flavobacteriales bacterium]